MSNHATKKIIFLFFITIGLAIGWYYNLPPFSHFVSQKTEEHTSAVAHTKVKANKKQAATIKPKQRAKFKVTVTQAHQKPYRAVHRYHGISEAKSIINLRAQTAGQIVQIPMEKGSQVKKGTVLCKIEDGGRSATLAQSEANLAKAESDYNVVKKLADKGHSASINVIRRRAEVEMARTAKIKAKLDLERTLVKAPANGIIADLPAKTGSFLNIGDLCANFVELDPLLIVAQVPEKDIKLFTPFMIARANLVTGEMVEGRIVYIAPASDPNTRTFRVELEIENKAYRLKSGISAKLTIDEKERDALLIAQRLISLNAAGALGLYRVDKDRKVHFMPITILSETQKGFWVDAPIKNPLLITEGQNFVTVGEQVEIGQRTAEAAANASPNLSEN